MSQVVVHTLPIAIIIAQGVRFETVGKGAG